MAPLCAWIGLMQYVDLSFNVTPVLHPDGFSLRWIWLDAGCLALMGGVLTKVFLRDLHRHPPYPLKDPRLLEAMGLLHAAPAHAASGELDVAGEHLQSGPLEKESA
jgi:hypothetical protein